MTPVRLVRQELAVLDLGFICTHLRAIAERPSRADQLRKPAYEIDKKYRNDGTRIASRCV